MDNDGPFIHLNFEGTQLAIKLRQKADINFHYPYVQNTVVLRYKPILVEFNEYFIYSEK